MAVAVAVAVLRVPIWLAGPVCPSEPVAVLESPPVISEALITVPQAEPP